jgi:hypothetical protein
VIETRFKSCSRLTYLEQNSLRRILQILILAFSPDLELKENRGEKMQTEDISTRLQYNTENESEF